jgi:hypothetical protein
VILAQEATPILRKGCGIKTFNIPHDKEFRIPLIKQLRQQEKQPYMLVRGVHPLL